MIDELFVPERGLAEKDLDLLARRRREIFLARQHLEELARAARARKGKAADLLVLSRNPLDDIANTRRIASVYLCGVQVNRTAYWLPGTAR